MLEENNCVVGPLSNRTFTPQEKAEFDRIEHAIEGHLANPTITLREHRRDRIAALERTVGPRKLIYLDTKYWIYLRDPDRSPNPEVSMELRRLLYEGVAKGTLLCPISFPLYVEILTQGIDRRLETAKIMDDLSMGICLGAPEDVYGIEYARFFIENHSGLRRFTKTVEPVWTKIGTMFGEFPPPPGLFAADRELALSKVMFDDQWTASVTWVATIRNKPTRSANSVSDQVNRERLSNPRGNQTFREMYRAELHGLLDFNQHIIDSAFRDVSSLVLRPVDIPSSSFWTEVPAHVFINLIREATTRRDTGIPMQRTQAALHAFLRLDEGRPYQENDTNDIRHTAAALAYCDLFLTERFFASLTARKEIQKVVPARCQVTWNDRDAVSVVSALS